MSERNQLILGLAWPMVVLIAILLTLLAFLLAWKTSAGVISSSSQAVPPRPDSQNKSSQDERRMIWWATFTALSGAVLAIRPVGRWASGFLWVSLILLILKLFHWTHDDWTSKLFGLTDNHDRWRRLIEHWWIAAIAGGAFVIGLILRGLESCPT